jgi:murein DD-endopeptidase MepM/ murein hydrolase activator NlpD
MAVGLDKGKQRKQKRHLSLILLPHFDDSVRTLKMNIAYSKILLILIVSMLILLCILFFSVFSTFQSIALRSQLSKLSTYNSEQEKRLLVKDSEISELKQKEKDLNKSIASFKSIVDTYISKNSSDKKTSRSSDLSYSSSISNLTEIKKTLEDINKSKKNVNKSDSQGKKLSNYAYNALPTYWPSQGRLSSRFGSRSDPFNSDSRFHEGIDIATNYGQNIRASADGTVIFSGSYSGYGRAIIISHGNGITTLYGHASKLLARKGQKVKKGSVIARTGSSGRSTGPHLHFEVHVNGTPVNPLKYLN